MAGVEKRLEIRGRDIIRGIQKIESGGGYARAPVFWIWYRGHRSVRDFEVLEHARLPDQTHRIQSKTLLTKSVNNITSILPYKELNCHITYEIHKLRVSI